MSRRAQKRRRKGFSILEAMVALAILSVALSSVFAAEVGSAKSAMRARRMDAATLLARCKMGEIEELISKEGLPADSKDDSDECCEEGPIDGYSCDWKIERVELPEPTLEGTNGDLSSDTGDEETPPEPDPATLTPESVLSGEGMSGGSGKCGGQAFDYAYPIMKPFIEEQVRRATVTVKWKEGSREHSFDVIQYVVAEAVAPIVETE